MWQYTLVHDKPLNETNKSAKIKLPSLNSGNRSFQELHCRHATFEFNTEI